MRFRAGVEGPAAVEVLMITSGGGKGHVFPKASPQHPGFYFFRPAGTCLHGSRCDC